MPTSATLTVDPPLGERARAVLAELGGRGPGPRRIWGGQPGRRSPWRGDDQGRLVLDAEDADDALVWLRFLLREVLSPTAAGAVARARSVGLGPPHRVRGSLVLDDGEGWPVQVRVSGRRLTVTDLRDATRALDGPGPAS